MFPSSCVGFHCPNNMPLFRTTFKEKSNKSDFFVGTVKKKRRGRPRLEDMTEEQKQARVVNNKVEFQIDALGLWLSDWLTRAWLWLLSLSQHEFENRPKKIKQERFELNSTSKILKQEETPFFCAEGDKIGWKQKDGEYKCQICEKVFKTERNLRIHVASPRSHVPEENRFYCYRNEIRIFLMWSPVKFTLHYSPVLIKFLYSKRTNSWIS